MKQYIRIVLTTITFLFFMGNVSANKAADDMVSADDGSVSVYVSALTELEAKKSEYAGMGREVIVQNMIDTIGRIASKMDFHDLTVMPQYLAAKEQQDPKEGDLVGVSAELRLLIKESALAVNAEMKDLLRASLQLKDAGDEGVEDGCEDKDFETCAAEISATITEMKWHYALLAEVLTDALRPVSLLASTIIIKPSKEGDV